MKDQISYIRLKQRIHWDIRHYHKLGAQDVVKALEEYLAKIEKANKPPYRDPSEYSQRLIDHLNKD